MAEGLGAADHVVLLGEDEVIKVVLRKKDSDSEELCVVSTPIKKNSFVKFRLEEREEEVVEDLGCLLCTGVDAASVGGGDVGEDQGERKEEEPEFRYCWSTLVCPVVYNCRGERTDLVTARRRLSTPCLESTGSTSAGASDTDDSP